MNMNYKEVLYNLLAVLLHSNLFISSSLMCPISKLQYDNVIILLKDEHSSLLVQAIRFKNVL